MFPLLRKFSSLGLIGIFSVSAWAAAGASEGPFRVSTSWTSEGTEQVLKAWDLQDLSKLKRVYSREKDPSTGRLTAYHGVLLSVFVEKALEQLPLDRRAAVDLIVFRNGDGGTAIVPRSLITKYPVMLATGSGDDLSVVVPWTSHSKVRSEGLPLEAYFIHHVNSIEFTNYHERYASLFLKRRTDPVAMRGEKIFVRDCASCHGGGKTPSVAELSAEGRARKIASDGHPNVAGAKSLPKLSDRDRRALVDYLAAYRGENPPSPPQQSPVAGGGVVPSANAAMTPVTPGH